MLEILKNYSQSKFPEEACGLILKDKTFIPIENIAEDKENYFRMHPTEYLKYYEDILAIFHSHTKNQPISDYDRKFCNLTYLPWAILILPEKLEILYPEEWEEELVEI